jgi:NADH-quinone oxidoreductase subunit F
MLQPVREGSEGTHPSACLGQCERAPAMLVEEAGAGGPVAGDEAPTLARGSRLLRWLSDDPTSIDDHLARGGGRALAHAREVGPNQVIAEVTEAGLLGRGGAGFPTGRKWAAVAAAPPRPHFFICNADESEPGTFKDRVLMERAPFAVLEAITVGALATGADRALIYIRGEYPLARERMAGAIAQARERGWFDSGLEVEIVRGAWAYICGEETALLNSIEGKRGEPRNKPPFPAERGLFGKPTAINNVETLVNVLDLAPEATASRLFCLSGHVQHPGVYEVDPGTQLSSLIAEAGGVRSSHSIQAVLLGGAAGSFLGPDQLDLPLTAADARAAGATLGSGAVVVFDETVELGKVLLRIARFFRHESCGQCVPCRVGTVRQEEILERLLAERSPGARGADAALLADVAQAMRDASICGLGQTAPSAIASALRLLA